MFDARVGRDFARELLQWGVTTVRNPAGPTDVKRSPFATRFAAASYPGPRILTAGEVIDQMPFEGLAATVRSVEDVRAEVNRQADAGVDFIKLYAGLTPPLVKAGIDAAHARGLQAVGHLWLTDWKTAADLGIDGIVHALPLSDRQLPESARATYMKGIVGTPGDVSVVRARGPRRRRHDRRRPGHGRARRVVRPDAGHGRSHVLRRRIAVHGAAVPRARHAGPRRELGRVHSIDELDRR